MVEIDSLNGVYKVGKPDFDADEEMNKRMDRLPDHDSNGEVFLSSTEKIVLKAAKRKKKITTLWVTENLDIPDRTSSYTLTNLCRKGFLGFEWERVMSTDGRKHNTRVFFPKKK